MKRILLIMAFVLVASVCFAKMGMDFSFSLGSGGAVVGPVGIDYDGAWSVYTDAWTQYTTTWE